jgi:hypothetical protein
MADTEAYPNSTVVCDNKGALQRCPADREWMKTTAKHFDLVSILTVASRKNPALFPAFSGKMKNGFRPKYI